MTSSLGGNSVSATQAQVSFDVTKESEVIALLKYIHQNPIDPETKNRLRDFIFSYRQDSSQASFEALKALCVAVGVSVTHEQVATLSKPIHTEHSMKFNGGRPLPSFTAASKRSPLPTAVSAPEPTASVSVPLRKIVVPTFEVTTPVQSVVEPIKKEVVEEAVIPPPPVPQSAPIDIATAQARISEIKHLVNAKVGNPVNLIDAHNEVGRLYMNALLDAMKKANGGVQGELTLAMGLLEEAYTQVIHALEGKPVVIPVQAPQPASVAQVAEVKVEVPVAIPNSQVQTPVASPQGVAEQERVNILEAKLQELKSKLAKNTQSVVAKPVIDTPIYAEVNNVPEQVEHRVSPERPSMPSVAKNKQLQDLLRSNRDKEISAVEIKQKEEIAKMDPIQTPEVTAGLGQLLSEWSLFRTSGFFGTGPSGKDHALFQKIGGLTMAAVIAGRFEGSTPLIKQSIADYMNGWRYEEGIIHEHGETFEHYLRKVVFHIVEKKKASLIRKS